jgi:phage FluMu protein Com
MPNRLLRCSRCNRSIVIAKSDDPNWKPPEDPEAWVLFGDDPRHAFFETVCPRCATSEDRQRKSDEVELDSAYETIEADRFLDEND